MSATLDEQLIELRLDKLLEKFGAGEATPGAGSGAALMGMLACKFCITVIKLTGEHPEYSPVMLQLGVMKKRLEILEEKLNDAFQRDSDEWGEVIVVRLKRNAELKGSEKRRQLADEARSLTENATDVLMEISKSCLVVLEDAIDLFEVGYHVVRGDSSVAVWAALAGAQSSLDTAYLNLKSFRDEKKASLVRAECDRMFKRAKSLQDEFDSKVMGLRSESLPAQPKPDEAVREELPLAARTTRAARAEETPIQKSRSVAKEPGIVRSDEEVFAKIFKGKNRDAWLTKIQEFFSLQNLGTFADNEDFLDYVKQCIREEGYRSPEKLTPGVLLKWYKTFKARERYEGPLL